MKTRWLFIDFDNTLMDTEAHGLPLLINRFNTLYSNIIESPLTLEIFQANFHGLSAKILCEKMSAYFHMDVDYALLFAEREQLMQSYYASLSSGVKMAPDVIPVLSDFKSQGITLALVTNNPLQRAFSAMRCANNQQGDQLAALFDANFFYADPLPKPDSDVYLRAIRDLKADPELTIAIEDSPTGVQSARGAGLVTLGYVGLSADPIHAVKRLSEAGCQATFDQWNSLRSILQ